MLNPSLLCSREKLAQAAQADQALHAPKHLDQHFRVCVGIDGNRLHIGAICCCGRHCVLNHETHLCPACGARGVEQNLHGSSSEVYMVEGENVGNYASLFGAWLRRYVT